MLSKKIQICLALVLLTASMAISGCASLGGDPSYASGGSCAVG